MTRINSADELPQLVAELKRQRFYGTLHLTFQNGSLTRLVTEHSQVFRDTNPTGETCK